MEQFTSACPIVVNTCDDFTENLAMLRCKHGHGPEGIGNALEIALSILPVSDKTSPTLLVLTPAIILRRPTKDHNRFCRKFSFEAIWGMISPSDSW